MTITVSAAAASVYHNPQVYYNSNSGDALFTVQNNTEVTEPKLEISSPYMDWQTHELNYSNNKSRYSTNVSFNRSNGVYFYRFTSQNEAFPNGHLAFIAGDLDDSVLQKGLNYQNNVSNWSANSACDLTSDFSCEYENHQAERMISAINFYRATSNETYLKRALNFSSRPFSETPRGSCDTFNCGTDDTENPLIVPSSVRQGALIEGLWTVYGASNNSSVRDLAEGYSQGHPAQCNVWNSDYNCTTGWSQGRMAMGYWTAYRVTGNTTYKDKAEKLVQYDFEHPLYGKALIEAYKTTGNETYRERAKSLAKNASCANCSELAEKEFFWEGFRSTGEYGFYRNAYEDSNQTCLNNSNSTCSYPLSQSRASKVLLHKYLGFQNKSKSIFNGRVEEKGKVGDPVRLAVDYTGMVENTTILYRRAGENWNSCEPGWFGECTLTENNSLKQGVYEYRFETQNLSLPSNGTLRFALNTRNEGLWSQSVGFADTGMEVLPDGEYCDPLDDQLACDDEGYQAKMILGYTQINSDTGNYSNTIYNLFYGPYVDFRGANPLCDPSNSAGDTAFNCENGGYADTSGSYKQGNLINSLFETYRETENGTVYERALNYTKGSAEDCDVWSNDFQCDTNRGQSAMIDGYMKAYEVTGNETYLNISDNLSDAAVQAESSKHLASSLWKSSSLLGDSSYMQKAENWTQGFEDTCSSDCTAEEYTDSLALARNAFVYGSNENYSTYYRSLVDSTTGFGDCGPYKEDYDCSNPGIQGKMISLFREAYYNVPIKYNVTSSFQLSTDEILKDQEFSSQCSVENKFEDENLTDVKLSLDISSNLSTSDEITYEAGNLAPNESANNTWNIRANSTGTQEVHCLITSSTGLEKTLVERILVSEEEKDNQNEDSESSDIGGGIGSSRGFDRSETIYYPLESVNWSNSMLEEKGLNTTLNEFSFNSSCLSAERTLESDSSYLEINYSCATTQNIVIIDELPENSSSRVEQFGNVSNSTLTLNYSYASSKELWAKPVALFSKQKELEMNTSIDSATSAENGTAFLSAKLNKPTHCSITRNNTILERLHTDQINYTAELVEGLNTIKLDCGEKTKTFTVNHEVEEKKNDFQLRELILPLIVLFYTLGSLSLAFTYRGRILGVKDKILFKWYFRKFQNAVEEQNVEKSIKVYSKLSSYADRDVSKSILDSNITLMRGLRVYLIMDLVEKGIQEGVSLPPNKVEDLVMNYLQNTDDKELYNLINQKLEKISELN